MIYKKSSAKDSFYLNYAVAEIEIRYKPKVKANERPVIKTSTDCYQLFLQSWNDETLEYLEQFNIILLSRANRVLGISKISSGGMAGCIVDTKVVLALALKSAASAIVLCHNHPSGGLEPSKADLTLTEALKKAADIMGIMIYDHIILTRDGYFSFADKGLL